MSEIVYWKKTIVGEGLSDAQSTWIARNQHRLLKAFPPSERAFCRIFDTMVSRIPQWKTRLWYTRQKCFKVAPEVLFFGDFYFRNLRLLVEIDGASHLGPQAREKDRWRSRLLSTFRGTSILRFANADVLHGDFRALEQCFIERAASSMPPNLGQKLWYDYTVMRQAHLHIYTDLTPLSTHQHRSAHR